MKISATGGSWVLTDVGLICPAGDTPQQLFAALLEGRTLAGRNDGDPPAVRIEGFPPKQYIDRKGLKLLSRTSQLAGAAASRLVDSLSGVDAGDIGVVLGTAWGSLDSIVRSQRSSSVSDRASTKRVTMIPSSK